MRKTEVMIADDKARYRAELRHMLEALPVKVVGEAENGKQLLGLLGKKEPDIVLLDLEMPVMDGNQALDLIMKHHPAVKVIILSSYGEELLIEHYIGRGAKGYIPKEALDPAVLSKALAQVSDDGIFLYGTGAGRKTFTARQKEIIPLIFEGLTNEEIAGEVHITTRAVEKQRHKIYQQVGAAKAIDLYKYAFARGLQFLGRAQSKG